MSFSNRFLYKVKQETAFNQKQKNEKLETSNPPFRILHISFENHSSIPLRDPLRTLEEIKEVAVPACQEFNVKRLDLFGSLARGEGTAESDVDLLVEFEETDLYPSKRFFGFLHHLEDVLGCEVERLFGKSFRAAHGSFRPIDARFFGP